ncbi:hypothetical protein ABFV62_32020, partial [Pseudomonas syringae]|uniref:hypothetical protein n=1 Tax=Pseudomonas syringae TaxID=317 RepID=UPI0034D71087
QFVLPVSIYCIKTCVNAVGAPGLSIFFFGMGGGFFWVVCWGCGWVYIICFFFGGGVVFVRFN